MKQSYQKSQSTYNLRHVCLIYHIYFMYPMKLLYKYHMFFHFMYHMKRSYHLYIYHLPVSIVMLCLRFLRQRRHLGSARSALSDCKRVEKGFWCQYARVDVRSDAEKTTKTTHWLDGQMDLITRNERTNQRLEKRENSSPIDESPSSSDYNLQLQRTEKFFTHFPTVLLNIEYHW